MLNDDGEWKGAQAKFFKAIMHKFIYKYLVGQIVILCIHSDGGYLRFHFIVQIKSFTSFQLSKTGRIVIPRCTTRASCKWIVQDFQFLPSTKARPLNWECSLEINTAWHAWEFLWEKIFLVQSVDILTIFSGLKNRGQSSSCCWSQKLPRTSPLGLKLGASPCAALVQRLQGPETFLSGSLL